MPSPPSVDKDEEFQWDQMGNLIRLNEEALPTVEENDSFPFCTWLDLAARGPAIYVLQTAIQAWR